MPIPDSIDQPPSAQLEGALHPESPPEGRARRRRRRVPIGADPSPGASALDSQRVPAILLAVVVVGSVLAIGTVHLPVLAVVAAGAFVAAALALYRQAQTHHGLTVPLPALIFAGLAFYTLLQVVPMPMRWLEVIAPANADVWNRSLMPFGEAGPAWAPISLDPSASVVEVLKWVTYAAVFLTASAIATRHGAMWGVLIVFGSAFIAALATLGHGVAGATRVWGLYQPHFRAIAWHLGPLLNANNLAGYLNLGALCGLGLLLSHRPPIPRWVIGLCVALIVAIDVTSASRAGVLALPLGVVGLALLTRRRDKDAQAGQSASTWLLVAVVAGGALLAALGGNDKAWSELRDKNLQKLEMLTWVKPMIQDHPLLGIGRGAFESVFPVYRPQPGNMVFTHPENFITQWMTEWGLPVAVASLIALGWAFGPRRLGARRSALAAGAWMGVAALLLQNLVDLALEIPAVCIGAATVLGSLWGDRRTHGPREALRVGAEPLEDNRARAAAIALGVLGAAAILSALRWGDPDVAADRVALRAALDRVKSLRPEALVPIRAQLRRAMLAHPAEPYFPLLGGSIAFRARDQSPIPWIQRTLERARMNGRAHLLLAEVLATRGARRQALLELRLALENDPALVSSVGPHAVRWSKTWEDLLSTVPEGTPGAPVLAELGMILWTPSHPGDPVLRSQCDGEALRRDPGLVQPRVREVEVRLQAIAANAGGVCADRAHCRMEILEHADAIAAAHPEASLAVEMRARLLMVEGKPDEAAKMLEKGCDRVSDRPSCLRVRVAAAASVKAPEALAAASKDLLGAGCVTNLACADTAEWLAGIRLGRNELGAALALLSRAAREDPHGEARWLRVAEVAGRSGAHVQAADALEKVSKHRGGADPELRRRIDAERAQALGGMLKR